MKTQGTKKNEPRFTGQVVGAKPPPVSPSFGAIQRVYCSSDGKQTAVVHRKTDGVWVTTNQEEFGPYEETDLTFRSVFRRSGWGPLFRAKVSDGYVLVADSSTFGPFDEVWNPQALGSHWGALVRKDDRYHLLLDGLMTEGFDEVAGDHRLALPFDFKDQTEIDVPLLFSDGRWLAFARREQKLFIVTEQGESGPFTAIGEQEFAMDSDELSSADLATHLCFERTRFSVTVTRKNEAGSEQHWLIVDGHEHGPFADRPYFRAARDMSLDGSRWAFIDEQGIHTHQGTTERTSAHSAVVSDTGNSLAYTYGPDNAVHLVVNSEEFGPFRGTQAPSLSPDGSRWIVGIFRDSGDQFMLTKDREFGPFTGGLSARPPEFLGEQWAAGGVNLDGTVSLLIDGLRHGPYKTAQLEKFTGSRSTRKEWRAHGIRADGMVDVFSRGKKVGTIGPFDSVSRLRTHGDHWSALVRKGDTRQLVENGIISEELPAFRVLVDHHYAKNASRIALHVRTEGGGQQILLAGQSFGPFTSRPAGFQFSNDGSHWGFFVKQDDGTSKVFADSFDAPVYDAITDFQVTRCGVVFVGTSGSDAWIQIGSERYGPFDYAGLGVDNQRVHAAVVKAGRLEIQSF